jgi:hypothetical protein
MRAAIASERLKRNGERQVGPVTASEERDLNFLLVRTMSISADPKNSGRAWHSAMKGFFRH